MITSDKNNETELLAFIPSIKSDMASWQIISVKLPRKDQAYYDSTVRELLDLYEHKEGLLMPINESKIMLIARLGNIKSYDLLKKDIEAKLPNRYARVIAKEMSSIGLKQVQLNLSDKGEGSEPLLYEKRDKRDENVFLIADDDDFVRQTLSSSLKNYGEVIQASDGSQVKELYRKHNPDIALLDIHMPNKDGLTLASELIDIDMDAFVIIASADSVKGNVMEALSGGAIGFLSKPIKKEKLLEYLSQCTTCNIDEK